MNRKCVLIEPSPLFSTNIATPNFVPTSILLVGSALQSQGIETTILSLRDLATPSVYDELEDYILKLRHIFAKYQDVGHFGISCFSSYEFIASYVIADTLRKECPQATIYLGGTGPSSHPQDYLEPGYPYDYVIIGEADLIFPTLITKVNAQQIDAHPASRRPELIRAESCPKISDLPSIKWELLQNTPYMQQPFLYVPIYASRGCPFQCKFCTDFKNSQLEYKKQWRPMPIARVIQEIQQIDSFFGSKPIIIDFTDPIFGLDHRWKEEFIETAIPVMKQFSNRGFGFEDRVDAIREKDIHAYQQLDSFLSIGLESGSPHVLSTMHKTPDPVAYLNKMKQVKSWCEREKMYWFPFLIFGYPGETRTDMQESQTYISQLFSDTHYGNFDVLKYKFHPGSQIYSELTQNAQNHGVLYPDWYHYIGNLQIISALIEPSKNLSLIDLYTEYAKWAKPLTFHVAENLQIHPNKKISSELFKLSARESIQHWQFIEKFIQNQYPVPQHFPFHELDCVIIN